MNISVIIPTFNRLSFTKKAISSVLNQTIKPKEIIVVDDGSTDDTYKLSKIQGINYIRLQINKGVSFARNTGIKNASHPWIAFLDSDDIWHKDKLKHQISFHKENSNIKISQTREIWIRDNKQKTQPLWAKKLNGDIFLPSLDNCLITASSVLIHKNILDNIGIFDENLEICEDYDLWLRISRKYNIGLIEKELITKYAGHNQLSTNYWGMDRWRIIALSKHLKDEKYHQIIKEKIQNKYKILINGAKKRGNLEVENKYKSKLQKL